jgi:DNA modification methylase
MAVDTPTAAVGCGDCGSSGSQALYGAVMAKRTQPADTEARPSFSSLDTQVIYCGDNLEQLRKMPAGFVDLIYIDPPFNSNRDYEVFWPEKAQKRAFEDRHESTRAYIDFMRPRCVQLHRVLKSTGSFYYHCDWHSDSYVRVMLDQIFGEAQFRSHIIWQRTTSHNDAKRQWGAVNDSIYFYTKSKSYNFNCQYRGYDKSYLSGKYRYQEPDGRVYRLSDLRSPQPRPNLMYTYKGYKPHPNGWAVSREKMEQLEAEGRLHFPKNPDGRIELKRYLGERKGMPIGNVWTDIAPVNSMASERIGFPTQKPVPLLERIVKASSEPQDILLDAFCGCGTALIAAEKLGRRWIGLDISPTACRVMAERLEKDCGLRQGTDFEVRDMPRSEDQLRQLPPFEFENWAVLALGGIPNAAKVGDWGIDGRIYPVDAMPDAREAEGKLGFMDHWYPIQAKQVDKARRPVVDSFVAAMIRAGRSKGYLVSFGFSPEAQAEIRAVRERSGQKIVPITVREILEKEEEVAKMLP